MNWWLLQKWKSALQKGGQKNCPTSNTHFKYNLLNMPPLLTLNLHFFMIFSLKPFQKKRRALSFLSHLLSLLKSTTKRKSRKSVRSPNYFSIVRPFLCLFRVFHQLLLIWHKRHSVSDYTNSDRLIESSRFLGFTMKMTNLWLICQYTNQNLLDTLYVN